MKKIRGEKLNKPKTKPRPKKLKEITIQSPVEPTAQIVVASELADDEMIEGELMGEVLPYYVYTFCEKKCKDLSLCTHRKTSGLSVKGVSETVRRLNRNKASGYKIRINPQYLKIERNVDQDGEKGVSVSVFAENLVDGNSAWGIKFEAYRKSGGQNGSYKNTFAEEKALSKAERNAKRKLIPETTVLKMIEKMIRENPNGVKLLTPVASEGRVIAPRQPQASSPEEIENIIRTAIAMAKTTEQVVEIDKKTQQSDKFSKEFKLEVRSISANRVDQLIKNKK